jgi:hypothetical protein
MLSDRIIAESKLCCKGFAMALKRIFTSLLKSRLTGSAGPEETEMHDHRASA